MKKNNQKMIESNFDQDESFSIDEIPSFESVTDESIANIKNRCTDLIEEKFGGYEPGALKAMLEVINGEFDEAYKILENDYAIRKNNLGLAYSAGEADLKNEIDNFPLKMAEHGAKLKRYNDYNMRLVGVDLPKELDIDSEHFEELKNKFEELKNGKK